MHLIWTRISSRRLPDVVHKEILARYEWTDKVFSGLVRDWLDISATSRMTVKGFEQTLSSQENDTDAANRTLDELDEHCEGIYKKFIQTGYKHLQDIKARFSEWQDVVIFDKLLNK